MRSMDPSAVTVVILARDEENTIENAIRSAAPFCREVVVMDGRSSDHTVERAKAAGARVVGDPGLGKGAAIRASLNECATEIVVFMDADGSHDANDIPNMIRPIIDKTADLAVGSRFAGGSDELSVSFAQLVRTIGNILMNIAINKRWNVQLTDTLNGYRAVRRQVALDVGLVENTHTIEQEMVMKFLRHHHRVVNVPAHEYKRQFGDSHIRIWREWPRFVWCVLENTVARDVPRSALQVTAGERIAKSAE